MGYVVFKISDLDQDGKKEIVLGNHATNNFPPDVYLSDTYSWLILLDHRLNLIKEPQRWGGKFSGVDVMTMASPVKN